MDADCDGSTMLHRTWVTGMDINAFTLLAHQRATQLPALGEVELLPIGSQSGQLAWVSLSVPLPWVSGLVHVYTSMSSISGQATCAVQLAGTGRSLQSSPLAVGTNVATFAVAPGGTITTLAVVCGGSGVARADWLTVQNGPYELPPITDLASEVEDMSLGAVGIHGFVRTSDDQSVVFLGADVGGLAWSVDGFDWTTANGDVDDWVYGDRLGSWDVWSPDGDEVYAITGSKDHGWPGSVWHSTDRGASFTDVAPDHSLSGSKHFDDCGTCDSADWEGGELDTAEEGYLACNTVPKAISTGRLLLHDELDAEVPDELLYIAVPGPSMWRGERNAGDPPFDRGVWVYRPATGDLWRPYPNDYPGDAEALPGWDCDDAVGVGVNCTAIPSALAFGESATEGTPVVVVGYRAMAYDGLADRNGLFVCERVEAGDVSGTEHPCVPVAAGAEIDVRDIEPNPVDPTEFFVVDGGYRHYEGNPGWPDECAAEAESTVYLLRVDAFDSNTVSLEELDDSTLATPDWLWPDEYYNGPNGLDNGPCVSAGSATGNLLPPDAVGSALATLTGIAVDPVTETVVAFYPAGLNTRDYDCVRWFRAPIADLTDGDGVYGWEPIQQVGRGTGDTYFNRWQRQSAVDLGGTSFRNEPLPEVALTGGTDATFVQTEPAASPDLLLLQSGPFWVLHAEDGAPGWESDASTYDLDQVRVEAGEVEGSAMHQSAWVQDVSTCHDCDLDLGDRVGYAVRDQGGGDAFARTGPTDPRRPATHLCQVTYQYVGGAAVDYWSDPAAGVWQRWQLQSAGDSTASRYLLFAEGAPGNDGTYCWQGVTAETHQSFIDPANNALVCGDGATANEIPTCGDDGEIELGMDNGGPGVGWMVAVEAFDRDRALILALPGCVSWGPPDEDPEGDSVCRVEAGGAGLFLATRDLTSKAITYEEIVNTAPAYCLDGTTPATRASIASGNSQIRIDEAGYARTGLVRAFISPGVPSCPIVSVDFDPDDVSTTTWAVWEADHPGNPCEDNPDLEYGDTGYRAIGLSPDGRTLLFGGGRAGAGVYYDASGATWSGPGGICAVNVGGINGDPTVESILDTNYEVVVPWDFLVQEIDVIAPHPLLDDAWVFGGTASAASVASAPYPLGLQWIQRRYAPMTNEWYWVWKRVADAGNGLENPNIADVDWINGTSAIPATGLAVGSWGGGLREVTILW